jgi:hypothetical protein
MLKFSHYLLLVVFLLVAPKPAKACDPLSCVLLSVFGGYVAFPVLSIAEAALNGVAAGFSGETRSDIMAQTGSNDERAKQVQDELLASTVLFSSAAVANLAFAGAFLGMTRDNVNGRKEALLGLSMGAAILNLVGMGLNIDAKSYTRGNQGYANNNHVDTMYATALASGISNTVGTVVTWLFFLLKKESDSLAVVSGVPNV